MARPTLDTARVSEAVRDKVEGFHQQVVAEVIEAVDAEDLVVVGMAQNPHVKRARKLLDGEGLPYRYLEYGSYFSQWRPRLALKMWSGWPTFPQVFVQGVLLGGASDLKAAIDDGSLRERLGEPEG